MLRKVTAGSRHLLKVISITIGIVFALYMLPHQWVSPLVRSVYAHELADVKNPAVKIFNEKYEQAGKVNSCDNHSFGQGSPFSIQFDYEASAGGVTDDYRIAVGHDFVVEKLVEDSHDVGLNETYPLITRTGDKSKGTIKMKWCITFQGRSAALVRFQLKKAGVAVSNITQSVNINRPAGAL
ncbi:MAG TPA: hypothetical protein VN328_06410 [Thermodesulfovibrionales bacterium]|nr:hypothetical protein [Thermodesulfovibrionales bacterium]